MTWLDWLFPLLVLVGILWVIRNARKKKKSHGRPTNQPPRQSGRTSETPRSSSLTLTPTKTKSIELQWPSSSTGPAPFRRSVPQAPLPDTPPLETLLVQNQFGQPEKDHWEVNESEVSYRFPVKAALHFQYVDGRGLATARTVDVRECGPYFDDTMFQGHCRLRDARRTFLVSRMKNCFDEDTGEVISDVAKYLHDRYVQSPEGAIDRWLEDEHDALRVLLYVAKADGYFRKPERAIIATYFRESINDPRITDDMVANVLGRLEVPSIHVFRRLVGKLRDRLPEMRARIIATVEKIIGTDKVVHPAEQDALDYLRKKWQ